MKNQSEKLTKIIDRIFPLAQLKFFILLSLVLFSSHFLMAENPPNGPVRVVTIKMDSSNTALNRRTLLREKLAKAILGEGASNIDLVVIPEFTFYKGYENDPVKIQALGSYFQVVSNGTIKSDEIVNAVKETQTWARTNNINIILGTVADLVTTIDDPALFVNVTFNTQLIIDRFGQIIGYKRKLTEWYPFNSFAETKQKALQSVRLFTLSTKSNISFTVFPIICDERNDWDMLTKAANFNADLIVSTESNASFNAPYEKICESIQNGTWDPFSLENWETMIRYIYIKGYINNRSIAKTSAWLVVADSGYKQGGIIEMHVPPSPLPTLKITDDYLYGIIQFKTQSEFPNQKPIITTAPWAVPNSIALPNYAKLNVFASDPDTGPLALRYTWSKVSGAGTATFTPNQTINSANCNASFSQGGSYILCVAVNDGIEEVLSYLPIFVSDGNATNKAPAVSAGFDQTISFSSVAQLSGRVIDDGLPLPLAVNWSHSYSPGTITFSNPYSLNTTAKFSRTGTFFISLKANDGSLNAISMVTVIVTPTTMKLSGVVTEKNTSLPISNALVSVNGFSGYSNSVGAYQVEGIPVGTFTASASKLDFTGDTASILFSADKVYDFKLIPLNQLPNITMQPANKTVSVGQTATFTVVATSIMPLTYQWRKNSVNISGATGSTYTTPLTSITDNNTFYSVIVSNTAGSVTSNDATLIVINKTFLITSTSGVNGSISPIGNVLVNQGSSQIFTMTPALGFQVDFVTIDNINVAATSSYTFSNVNAAHSISVKFKLSGTSNPNLVGHWKLDEKIGTTAFDSSDHGNGGTLVNSPAWTAGQNGGALSFNGTNQFMKVNNSPSLEVGKNGVDFSVAYWIYLKQGSNNQWRSIMHKGIVDSERTFGMWMYPWDNRIYFSITTTATWNEGGYSIGQVPINQWTHIAYVKNGNVLKLYLNGVIDSQVNLAGTSIGNTGPITFGKDAWWSGINGNLDDIRIYNRALSVADVLKLIGTADPSLLGHWKLDETSGTIALDSSGNGNSGTLVNTPAWTTGQNGGALSFNGTTQLISVNNSSSLEVGKNGADFSIAYWLYLKQGSNLQWRSIMHKGQSDSERTFSMWMSPWDNRIYFSITTTANWNEGGYSIGQIPVNQWAHIAYVKNANVLKFYLNGVLDSQVNLTGTSVSNTGPITFGKDAWWSGINGNLDDIRIYNRALNVTEIVTLSGK